MRHAQAPGGHGPVFAAVIQEHPWALCGQLLLYDGDALLHLADQLLGAVLHIENPAQVAQVVVGVVEAGRRTLHDEGTGLGQFVHRDVQRRQGLRGQVAADAHAVVPAGEEEVDIGVEQGFHRRVLAGQLRQALEFFAQFRGDRLPATDTAVADHALAQAEGEHHLGHVDVMAQGMRRGLVEGHLAVAALDGQRVLGRLGEGAGAGEQAQQQKQGGSNHRWVIQVRRGWSARGWRSISACTPKTSCSNSLVSTSLGVPLATMRPWSSTYRRSQKAAARFRSWMLARVPIPRRRTCCKSSS
ncbi:hypothetical protein D3C76_1068080 [compost metagenome]